MAARERLSGSRPRARAAALPAGVRLALERVLGERVGHVRVIEHSWFARLHGRAVATTRPGRIYLRGAGAEFFSNPWLMLHEYCHVLRQWQPGALTVTRYLLECLRRGYWNNRFEVEARAYADAHAAELHALIGGAGAGSPEQRFTPIEPGGDRQQQRAAAERHHD
jgi:hypothetical protein